MPGYVNYKKGCTRLAAASDKVYQLLAHGRWFSQGTPASSTSKRVAMIELKYCGSGVKHNKSNQIESTHNEDSINKRQKIDQIFFLLIVSFQHIFLQGII